VAHGVEAVFDLLTKTLDALIVAGFAYAHIRNFSGNGVDVLFEQTIAEAVLFITASLVGSGNLGIGIQFSLEHGVLSHEGGSLIAVAIAKQATKKTAIATAAAQLIDEANSTSDTETEGSTSYTFASKFTHSEPPMLRPGGMP
jgi:DNA integrity scanning protein DisA with diadenylate cyclase activity